MKPKVFLAAVALSLALASFGISRYRSPHDSGQSFRTSPPAKSSTGQMPEHLPWEILFRRIDFLVSKKIPDDKLYALLRQELDVTPTQAYRIKRLALDTVARARRQDARANEVIARIRSQYPDRIIHANQELPDSSPELVLMQQERNAMFLNARTALLGYFDSDAVGQLEQKLRERVDYMSRPGKPAANRTGGVR